MPHRHQTYILRNTVWWQCCVMFFDLNVVAADYHLPIQTQSCWCRLHACPAWLRIACWVARAGKPAAVVNIYVYVVKIFDYYSIEVCKLIKKEPPHFFCLFTGTCNCLRATMIGCSETCLRGDRDKATGPTTDFSSLQDAHHVCHMIADVLVIMTVPCIIYTCLPVAPPNNQCILWQAHECHRV